MIYLKIINKVNYLTSFLTGKIFDKDDLGSLSKLVIIINKEKIRISEYK